MKFEYDSRKNCAIRMKREETFFSVSHFATPLPPVTWIHTFSAKERDTETGLSVTSLRSVSSSSLSQAQTSLAWHSLIRRFGSRYYSSDLSIWLSVDPQSDKYPSFSPYVYCANNPIKLVDPNGEEIWIPGIDKKGNVTYTAEKGDDHDSFVRQFNTQGKSREIFKNAGLGINSGDVKEGDIIKGDAVKKATGSDVLKGNWHNMNDSQKASQIMFALNYGEQNENSLPNNAFAIDLNNFINGFYTPTGGLTLNDVKVPEKGGTIINVNMRIWSSEGLTDSKGNIPIYYRVQSRGEYYQTLYYYSAKNPKAKYPLPAISVTPH